jgi:hypothetical protein
VCDGVGCQKAHIHPDYPCNGATVIAQATNRVHGELIAEMRRHNPRVRPTPGAVLAFLQQENDD